MQSYHTVTLARNTHPHSMNKTNARTAEEQQLVDAIVQGMQEKKASDIVVLDLTKIPNAVSSYFIICSGNSDTQVDAIAGSVEEFTHKQCKERPWKREGLRQREWVLLDYVSVVAHIFLKNKRTFYALEELWGDAEVRLVEEI